MSNPAAAKRRASACTFETSGQVASITSSPRALPRPGGPPARRRGRRRSPSAPSGTSSSSSTKIAPRSSQRAHDVGVVDDLLAHVDRRSAVLECALDDLDRALDPGARGARRGEHDLARAERLGPLLDQRAGAAQRPVGAGEAAQWCCSGRCSSRWPCRAPRASSPADGCAPQAPARPTPCRPRPRLWRTEPRGARRSPAAGSRRSAPT